MTYSHHITDEKFFDNTRPNAHRNKRYIEIKNKADFLSFPFLSKIWVLGSYAHCKNIGELLGRDLYIAKNQKLCQSQNLKWKNFAKAEYWHSKFGQYYRYDITMYDFIHIIHFLIPIWSWISKMMLENETFFTFLLKCC